MTEETPPVKEAPDESTLETSPLGIDKPVPEAPSDEPPHDDSAEAENTEGETPLHELLFRMAKDDKEPKKTADLDELSRLLNGRAQVNAKDADGQTTLHLAAANGLVEAAEKLIDAGANVSEPDNEKRQPLHRACSKGHVSVVNLLLKNGADTQITEEDSWSPLHFASRHGHTEVIRALLEENKKNINAKEALEGWTALNVAIYNGHDVAVSTLLEKEAKVGIQDKEGWTPLMTAIQQKHKGTVEKLLNQNGHLELEARKRSLELETRNNSGHTPLLSASINGFLAGASLLIKAGADCNVQSTNSNCTPLIAASDWRYSGVVKFLLGTGLIDVNAHKKDKWTALHEASDKGNSKIVEILLQHQPDVHLPNDEGRTALHLSSHNGNENIVKQLLKAGAKVDAKDEDGKTALHLASGAGPEDYSEQEGELGPDDLSSDEKEMMEFRSGRHAAVVKLLLEHEAKPDAKTNNNETALHLAAARGDPDRLDLILASMGQEHMSVKNDQGRTALYLACTGDNTADAWESLLKSDKLRTAEFGRSDVDDDKIKWAAKYPDPYFHEIAQELMEERLTEQEMAQPTGSYGWSVIEWAAYSQLPEVLSLLIGHSPKSSDTQAALKYALKSKLESTLQSVHEPGEDAEQSKFRKVLELLIADALPTTDLGEALKFVLDMILDLALGTRVNQGAGHRQLLQVLSLFTDSISGTPKIKETLESALRLAEKAEDQPQSPEQGSLPPKTSKDEAGTSSQKGKEKGPEKTENRREKNPLEPTGTAKDPETKIHRRALVDILRDPPFSQTHKDIRIDGPPKHSPKLSETLESLEATIVQFYKNEDESGAFRRYRSLKEVIYDDGPGRVMKKTISDLREILGGRSELAKSIIYLNSEPKFTWVHLPATNMVWMNDILMRIMNDERCEVRPYHELKSFFRDSWVQVPDRTSSSRSMRPRTVLRRQENETEEKKGEDKPDFGVASATYMPYFCFSTYYENGPSPGQKQKKFVEMKEAYEGLDDSKSSVIHESPTLDEWYYQFATDGNSEQDRKGRNRSQVVTKAMKSNKSTKEGEEDGPGEWTLVRVNQLWAWTVANKWLITASPCLFDDSNGTLVEGILEQLGKEVEAGGSASQPDSAADMCRFVVDYCIGTYDRLAKLQESKPEQSKPGESQPEEPKSQDQGSIRQIFSNTINQIGREEASLLEEFRKQTARWREKIPGEQKKRTEKAPSPGDEPSSGGSLKAFLKTLFKPPLKAPPEASSDNASETAPEDPTYEHIRASIKKAEDMYCEIKDIRDELNILKSAAQHQKAVEEGLTGATLDVNLAAAYIVKDLKEMDNSAERIQSAINTTLSLLQSESANLQATLSLDQSKLSNQLADLATKQGDETVKQGKEARRQGNILMVFTLVTILFLPLSFLSSLFALDVESFQQAPGWAFAVIFAVSFTFSIITAWVARRWATISPDEKSTNPGTKSPEEKSDGKVEGRSTMGRSPEPRSEPVTDSHQQPLFPGLEGRLRRREWDIV